MLFDLLPNLTGCCKNGTVFHVALQSGKTMNYLAHAYLSFQQPAYSRGIWSRFVKGRLYTYSRYSEGLPSTGYRQLQIFTRSPGMQKSLSCPYRLYSGAFVDVVYDHFLPWCNEFVKVRAGSFYAGYLQLLHRGCNLPAKFSRMLPYMQQQNWLYHYRLRRHWKSFGGLRRAAYRQNRRLRSFIYFALSHPWSMLPMLFPELRICPRPFNSLK